MLQKKPYIWRGLFYFSGLILLALGITLNTKTDLGVSPIIAVPFSAATVSGSNLSVLIFLFYSLCLLMEWVLDRNDFRSVDFLQLLMSFLTSFFIGLFDLWIPAAPDGFAARLAVLAIAIALTGLGAALTVMMQLVPNPADALARIIGKKTGKNFGFGKNLFDFCCASIAIVIGLLFARKIVGIGLGTVIAVLFTGRMIALTDHFLGYHLQTLAGLVPSPDLE